MKKLLLLTISVLILTMPLLAQTSTGTITGQVFDQNKEALSGAAITLTDVQTNSTRTATTNESGIYGFSSLQPGKYRPSVEKAGFKTTVIQAVDIFTAGTSMTDVTLEIGTANETVEVTSETPLLTPDTPLLSTTIENKLLLDIPFAERSALGAVLIAPGVQGDPQYQGGVQSENPGIFTQPVTPGGSISISGGRPGSSSILVDGADNTLVGYPRTSVSFSGDTVQEVTVQQNGLPAQYGRTGGGMIDFQRHFNALKKRGYNGNISLEPHLDGSAEIIARGKTAAERLWVMTEQQTA